MEFKAIWMYVFGGARVQPNENVWKKAATAEWAKSDLCAVIKNDGSNRFSAVELIACIGAFTSCLEISEKGNNNPKKEWRRKNHTKRTKKGEKKILTKKSKLKQQKKNLPSSIQCIACCERWNNFHEKFVRSIYILFIFGYSFVLVRSFFINGQATQRMKMYGRKNIYHVTSLHRRLAMAFLLLLHVSIKLRAMFCGDNSKLKHTMFKAFILLLFVFVWWLFG